MPTDMRIDAWSDIACPWCYVGKRRLETALSRFPHRENVRVIWHRSSSTQARHGWRSRHRPRVLGPLCARPTKASRLASVWRLSSCWFIARRMPASLCSHFRRTSRARSAPRVVSACLASASQLAVAQPSAVDIANPIAAYESKLRWKTFTGARLRSATAARLPRACSRFCRTCQAEHALPSLQSRAPDNRRSLVRACGGSDRVLRRRSLNPATTDTCG